MQQSNSFQWKAALFRSNGLYLTVLDNPPGSPKVPPRVFGPLGPKNPAGAISEQLNVLNTTDKHLLGMTQKSGPGCSKGG